MLTNNSVEDYVYVSSQVSSKKFNLLLMLLCAMITMTPWLSRELPKVVNIILICLWHFDILFFEKKEGKFPKAYVCLWLWFIWCLLYKVLGYSTASIGNYYIELCTIDMMIKSLYVLEHYNDDDKNKLLRYLQIVLLFTLISNLVAFYKNPISFMAFDYYPERYMGTNKIEATLFYNMLAFHVGANICLYKADNARLSKLLDVLSVVLSLLVMFLINPRMNAILICVCLVVLMAYMKNKLYSLKRIMVTMVIIMLVCCIVIMFGTYILNLLPKRLFLRVQSLISLVNGDEMMLQDTSLSARAHLQATSLMTFVSNPINFLIGVGLHLGMEWIDIIGQHGEIADTLAAYGVMGLCFIVYLFTSLRKTYIVRIKDSSLQRYAKAVWATFFFALCISSSLRTEVIISAFLMLACMDCYRTNPIKGDRDA